MKLILFRLTLIYFLNKALNEKNSINISGTYLVLTIKYRILCFRSWGLLWPPGRERMCQLRGYLDAPVAPRRHWSLPLQCMRVIQQNERHEQASVAAAEATRGSSNGKS